MLATKVIPPLLPTKPDKYVLPNKKVVVHKKITYELFETTEATTTTAKVTTTTASHAKKVVLTDVQYEKTYSLADYHPSDIKEIVLQLDGEVGYGFGGKLVLGGWAVQMDYGVADMKDDKTITFKITNPQDVMTVYGYWGNMKLKSVTLVY